MSSQTQRKPFQQTPEQIALSEERKAKRQENRASADQVQGVQETHPALFIHRAWVPVQPPLNKYGNQIIKVLTWNLLAQCLIRRDLFPTSNCLKAGQREHMLYHELLATDADIMCLQEVDRLEKLLPVLDKGGYAHHYAASPGKKHGCLIAFKENLYSIAGNKLVEYDTQELRSDGNKNTRYGRSFNTRNIGSLVLLRSNIEESEGILVATTHLFWHPKYTYERTRQAAILLREALKFRNEAGCDSWPCIIGGDFNFAPDDPAYSLLVGDPLLPAQEERLTSSQVVHVSVDPTVATMAKVVTDEAGGEEDSDPDKVITNARPATLTDGLLSLTELVEMFSQFPRLRSAYDEGLGQVAIANRLRTFGHRVLIPSPRRGRYEPEYTSYTHYWKTVLDYIFVLDPVNRPSKVIGLLAPHNVEDFKSGLPQKDVCGSDHVSLAAKLCWADVTSPLYCYYPSIQEGRDNR